MRIALLGKGGTGKTTLTSLLARHFARRGLRVQLFDATPALELAAAFGLTDEENVPPALGPALSNGGPASLEAFARDTDGVSLFVAGQPELTGDAPSFHGLRAAEFFLDRTRSDDETVLVDFGASWEAVLHARLDRGVDRVIFVVDATPAATANYLRYLELAEPTVVIGNRVSGKYDAQFLRAELGDDLLTCFAESSVLGRVQRGGHDPLDGLECGNLDALAILERHLGLAHTHATPLVLSA